MHSDARLIHLWSRAEVIDHPGQHAISGWASFNRRLPSSWTTIRKVTDPIGKDRGKALCQILLAAIEPISPLSPSVQALWPLLGKRR